jgi:hypothetical protein
LQQISATIYSVMLRFNIVLALLISVILIGGSVFMRTYNNFSQEPLLLAVSGPENPLFSDEAILEPNTSNTTASSTPLNTTDIISRQLFSDYIELSAKNQATPENLSALAGRYAEAILSSNSAPFVNEGQIILTSDSNEALLTYNRAFFNTRDKYTAQVTGLPQQFVFSDVSDPQFKAFMITLGGLYAQVASDLIKIPVPQSLAKNHVKLINNYLSNHKASLVIADFSENPIEAFSALNIQSKNSAEEAALLSNIRVALLNKGLDPSRQDI